MLFDRKSVPRVVRSRDQCGELTTGTYQIGPREYQSLLYSRTNECPVEGAEVFPYRSGLRKVKCAELPAVSEGVIHAIRTKFWCIAFQEWIIFFIQTVR